jgi:signal peptidase II
MTSMLSWLWLSLAVIGLDQLSKRLIDQSMQLYQTVELLPFFQLTYLRNQGAAFSFLSQAGGWQRWFFIALAVVASLAICYWLNRLGRHQRFEAAAWALVLGGALGNLIDRTLYGYVIDFLDVFYRDWHWPAFNVADSAITVGVAMLLVDSVRPKRVSEEA